MNKRKLATKMRSNIERKLKVSVFSTIAWQERKNAIAQRVKKTEAVRHFHAEQRKNRVS